MQELRLGDQLIRYDRDATAVAYAALPGGALIVVAAYTVATSLFNEILCIHKPSALLGNLGIDPNKEGHVYDMVGPFEDNPPTRGWFILWGNWLSRVSD